MINSLNDKKITKMAKTTLSKYKLCDYCLGRLFAKIETGLTNKRRGQLIKKKISKVIKKQK